MIAKTGQDDNLSHLEAELDEIEQLHIKSRSTELAQTRINLATTLQVYTHSRFEVGKILFEYKKHFKRAHGWVVAAEAIGAAINRDKRTVYRIIRDYEIATQLHAMLLNALACRDIDPAQTRSTKLVQVLIKVPTPSSSEDAEAIVSAAIEKVAKMSARKTVNAEPDSFEDFTKQVVRLFVDRYGSKTRKECDNEVRNTLELVVAALGVEAYDLRKSGRQKLHSNSIPDVQKPVPASKASISSVSPYGDLPLFANLRVDAAA